MTSDHLLPHTTHLAEPVREWIEAAGRLRARLNLAPTDLASRRQVAQGISDELALSYAAPIPEGVEIDEVSVPVDAERRIRVRRYRPRQVKGPLPSQIWLHGGGFVFGAVDELINDRLCAGRTAATGVQILSVDYRLAPEHPYPAPVDDVVSVFDAAVSGSTLEADPDRVGLGGNSAGGAIAASAALRIRDTWDAPLRHLLLEVPLLTFKPFGASATDFDLDQGPLAPGTPDVTDAVARAYLPAGAVDRWAVPFDADLAGLPPTVVLTAEFDPLRDAAEEFVMRLRSVAVQVVSIRGEGHLHGTCSVTARWEGARQWQADAASTMITDYQGPGYGAVDRGPSA